MKRSLTFRQKTMDYPLRKMSVLITPKNANEKSSTFGQKPSTNPLEKVMFGTF